IELRLLSPVSRVPYFLLPNEGLAPLAMDMSPTYVGYKFRSLALANCPTNSNLSRLVFKLWDTCDRKAAKRCAEARFPGAAES
ncbi:MAG: hypothetical protein J6J97_08165, partial [Akkermansia sp.]|nr:hypothetical protein [Akkermansia sp.]